MYKAWILFAVSALTVLSCAKKPVMGELPSHTDIASDSVSANEQRVDRERILTNTLEYQYNIFRINQAQYSTKPYTLSDEVFFTALSNEFDDDSMDRSNSLSSAAQVYLSLTNRYTNEAAFLYVRAAACYFQLGDYGSVNKWLNLGMMSGYASDEVYYQKAQLLAYYQTNFETALFYAKQIKPKYLYVHPQDFYYFLGDLYRLTGDFRKAAASYKEAVNLAPDRFYILYDLVPAYLSMNETGMAQDYCNASFNYLTSLDQPDLRLKAYRQCIDLNRALRVPTWTYDFNLSEGYDLFPDLFYFLPNKIYIKRLLTSNLMLPVKEKKERRYDEVYYPTYEDVVDFNGGTGYFLTAGRMSYTNDLLLKVLDIYCPTSRLYYQTNVAILMTPTNVYLSITNTAVPTNSDMYVQTVESNGIDVEPLDFDYYITTDKFDVDGDRQWDFIVLGYNKTNDVVVSVYYPSRYGAEYYHFTMTRHDAQIVVQDIDRDGKNEIVVFDKDVTVLKD